MDNMKPLYSVTKGDVTIAISRDGIMATVARAFRVPRYLLERQECTLLTPKEREAEEYQPTPDDMEFVSSRSCDTAKADKQARELFARQHPPGDE